MVRVIDRLSGMNLRLILAILLGIVNNKLISADTDIYQSIEDDLRNMNITCPNEHNCMEARGKDDLDYSYSCHCAQFCTRMNSCCYNSPYNLVKQPEVLQACTKISDTEAYFMVDRCPKSDSFWERLCHEEWDGEDNAMKLVPVTSLYTHITYKNYYCFRCHEAGEDFVYWNVKLGSNSYEFDETANDNEVSVNYNQTSRTWVAPLGKCGALIPVYLNIERPWELYQLSIECKPNVISRCSDEWTDKDVRDKCEAYMGIVYVYSTHNYKYIMYRNAHCALCNFEDAVNLYCSIAIIPKLGAGKRPFSFTHLLDIKRSDGDEVGKVRKCGKDFLWDPFAKSCRKLACALPGFVVRDGKCTPS